MEKTLEGFNAINGKMGSAYAQIDGNNELMFYAKAIEATAEKTKGTVKPVGKVTVGHKTSGLEITGSMTLYYYSPMFRKKLEEYKKTGIDPYFDLVINNEDDASDAGKQSLLLKGVNLNSVVLAKLDGDSDDPLEEEVEFTAEDFDYLQHFNQN